MTRIRTILESLVMYYSSTRCVGHTYRMLHGVINTKGKTIVMSEASRLDGIPKEEIITLSGVASYRLHGLHDPLAIDNFALLSIFQDSLEEINKLEALLKSKEKENYELYKQVKELKEQIDEQNKSS